jgi:signal transduction histidine kinase
MTDLDRVLRTLSRMHNAAPPVAADRISDVMALLLRLNAENEYLNTRLMETLNAPVEFEPPIHEEDTPVKPLGTPDVPILEELFRVDRSSTVDLFSDFDPALFSDEIPAVTLETTEEPVSDGHSRLDFYEHLETIIADRLLPEVDVEPSQRTELTEEEREALAQSLRSGWLPQFQEDNGVPDAEQLLARLNEVLKPSLLVLRGQAESLYEGKLGKLSGNQTDGLKLMLTNADSALALLDSLELVNQLRHGTLTLQPSEFDPMQLLFTARQVVQRRANERDHQISIQEDDALPMVTADFERTLIILIDILDNAIRYTANDGAIRLSADTMGTHVLFTVADTGIGFTPEEGEQIGESFWRALDQPLVRHHPGTGLRLFLAKRILALQGGELFFSGEPSLGSSFSFTLPAAETS